MPLSFDISFLSHLSEDFEIKYYGNHIILDVDFLTDI